MSDVMTLQQFADLTDDNFREIVKQSEKGSQDMRDTFYTMSDSDKEVEKGSAVTGLGGFENFTTSGTKTYKAITQGYDWSATHVEWALGIQIQRRLWRFDRFDVVEDFWRELSVSGFETQQIHAARFFNEGFSNTSLINFSHSRAEAPFADSHAVLTGASTSAGFDNKIATAFSHTALKTARTNARQLRDDNARVRGFELDAIVVPPALQFDVEEVVQTMKGIPDSADNTKNVNQGLRVIVWDKLTDSNNWFAVNMAKLKRNLAWYTADALEFSNVLDFDTEIAKYSGYMQYTTAWKDWRIGIGSEVS